MSEEFWNCVCIPLTQGKHALIDVEDFPDISRYKWHAKNSRGKWYANRAEYINGKHHRVGMHQQILGISGRKVIGDHRDGNGLDNRRQNIRKATYHNNNTNTGIRRDNKTGFKGVSYVQNRFRVNIASYGKQIFVGGFDNPIDAAKAYDKAAIAMHGEFTGLNFPNEAAHG